MPEWTASFGVDDSVQESGREPVIKRYHYRVFLYALPAGGHVMPGALCEWLTTKELLDEDREPISPTARDLIRKLGVAGEMEKPGQSALGYCIDMAAKDPGGPE